MGVPERVVDLVEDGTQAIGRVVAEPDRDRVEGVPEDPREHQHPDGPSLEIDALACEVAFEPGSQVGSVPRPVIPVVERHQIESIPRQDRRSPGDVVDLVQVHEERPHAIPELVTHRLETPVADHRFVDRRGR